LQVRSEVHFHEMRVKTAGGCVNLTEVAQA
jgi:hypothetical protein